MPQSVEPLTTGDVAGVLDQLYRAAGPEPRRFYLRNEELQKLAGRTRSLRPEFFDQTGSELDICHSILMSYPRLDRGGTLGFVSLVFAERWPAADDDAVSEAISQGRASWVDTVRARLDQLRDRPQPLSTETGPLSLTESQLCRIVEESRFHESWWSDLMAGFVKATGPGRPILFMHGPNRARTFVVTNHQHIRTWYHPSKDDWDKAVKRYRLDETD